MKQVKEILYRVAIEAVHGKTDVNINRICMDSRQAGEGALFIAIPGTISDGHAYIDTAIAGGASAIVCERMPELRSAEVCYIQVNDAHEALAYIADNFYDSPSKELQLVGVTGTNGKTTIATLLASLFTQLGYVTGLLSTVKIQVGDQTFPATHTTPDAITINCYLREMVDAGVDYCFMEVSSHGIHQKRTKALHFAGGIFTNLTHDHLDYHKTFGEYRDVKKTFFDELPKSAFSIVNIDDKNGLVMQQNTASRKRTYGLKNYADYRAQILENQLSGLVLKLDNQEVYTRLIGSFNAYNLVAIYATAIELGVEPLEALQGISQLQSVAGRFQYQVSPAGITAVVDYAHTPDALENVLATLNDVRTKNEKLITVVGCGGDRDASKRPIMARIAAEQSDHVILTSDNPRSEDPQAILDEMEKGVPAHLYNRTTQIVDRRQAIKLAVQMAGPNDLILIAGKGHETYQEINGVKHHFDDTEVVREMIELLNK